MNQWYSYAAINRDGTVIHGHKLAASVKQVRQWLAQEQILLLNVKAGASGYPRLRDCLPHLGSSLDLQTLEALAAGLSVLLGSNVLLPEALEILMSAGDERVALVAYKLHTRLQSGQNLSAACEEEAGVFGHVYPKLFLVGESTGDLALVFQEIQQSARWHRELQQRISQLLAYPFFMLVVMMSVLVFLLVHVVPQLLVFVGSVQQDFPWYTTLLFYLSSLLVERGEVVITGLVLILSAIGICQQLLRRRGPVDTVLGKVWFVGPLVRQVKLARYFHVLAILSRSGIDYPTAVSQASLTLGNREMEQLANSINVQVNHGRSLSEAMRHCGLFPQQVWRMVAVGERSGDLSDIFKHIASHYDTDLTNRIARIEQCLPTALIVVIGLVLMWIIVSVLSPLYETMISSGADIL